MLVSPREWRLRREKVAEQVNRFAARCPLPAARCPLPEYHTFNPPMQ
jgi:hypothetical protein